MKINKKTKNICNMLLDCNNLAYIICFMTKQELIALAGSQTELGKILGISQAAVAAWNEIPKARIWQLKLLRPKWFKKKK
jgi:hypothetical protein